MLPTPPHHHQLLHHLLPPPIRRPRLHHHLRRPRGWRAPAARLRRSLSVLAGRAYHADGGDEGGSEEDEEDGAEDADCGDGEE
ncbi:hypothetical protein CHGG_09014 [Chaetomium globosum CBS 148.51]|uniref:Uncharacterized protein n=1 Tax=Chaetomium globosum (strain ATCC 6205 / CBS 148.51 / DSM 1962 / NBRC 6347 / NRRL 1970) TaxID=306901 RepID=Q2GSP0_CHAGB|nr:uncharacterized protein CHGG_09014 [Chaetomium globosum CBS 148.51]EAQ85000.1 hypothetical protein CHGG_09014 [Chaetomium globosum CBS 148.51]